MSPYETEDRTRRISRRAKWMTWATFITLAVAALAVVAVVQQANRNHDLSRSIEASQLERYRNTLTSCEDQNARNARAKDQLRGFLASLPSDPSQTTAQRRASLKILGTFTDLLADTLQPARLNADGSSGCEQYARSRVQAP